MKHKAIFSLGLAFAAAGFFIVPRAYAGEPPNISSSSCKINKDRVAAIEAVQANPNLDNLQAIREELALRKALLHDIVNCASNDAQSLKDRLDTSRTTDAVAAALQQGFSDALGEAIRHYSTEGDKIDTLALGGSIKFANDLKDWRANTYIPLENRASKFVLWLKNQELIAAAQKRLDQVSLTTNVLKLIDNDDIANLLAKAKSNLATATAADTGAFQIFKDPNATDDPLPLLKSALQSLSDTYGNLLDLSALVQKILPH